VHVGERKKARSKRDHPLFLNDLEKKEGATGEKCSGIERCQGGVGTTKKRKKASGKGQKCFREKSAHKKKNHHPRGTEGGGSTKPRPCQKKKGVNAETWVQNKKTGVV